MYNYLNGYSNPVWHIFDPALNGDFRTVALDFRYQALKEYIEDTFIEHTLIDGQILQEYQYSRLLWELDLSALASVTNLEKLKDVADCIKRGWTVIMFPHADSMERYFQIILDSKSYTLDMWYGGQNMAGMKGFMMKFKTKYVLADWWFLNPNTQVINAPDEFEVTISLS